MSYPIVFIPGLFGSMGNDVIPGTGDFSFGFAESIYRPFINILNSMGYEEEKDLFISYYDWKQSVSYSSKKYLYNTVERAKKISGKNKVILIAHSLGGLISRYYIENINSLSVDKLIMIGTPNLGAANAYYFWSGGNLPYTRIEENLLYNGLKVSFYLYYYLFNKMHYLEGLREIFPVAKDLLPCIHYGDYLFYKENGIDKKIPIESMSIENSFLNNMKDRNLNKNNLFIISGKGVNTNKEFLVDRNMSKTNNVKWTDGKPKLINKTNYGDGTVTTPSTFGNLNGNNISIKGNHINILYKSKDHISKILGKPIVKEVKAEEVDKIYIIFSSNCNKINIMTSNSNQITTSSNNINDDRIKVINISSNKQLTMIRGDKDFKMDLEVEGSKKLKSQIYMAQIDKKEGFKIITNPLKYKI